MRLGACVGFLALSLSVAAHAQTHRTLLSRAEAAHQRQFAFLAGPTRTIVKAYADPGDTDPNTHRRTTTGNLHILYSDGSQIVEKLRGDARRNAWNSQAGFSHITIAKDRQTVVWTEDYYVNAATPYPLFLVFFRRGRIIFRDSSAMLWNWHFLDNGDRAVAVWGTAHGTACPFVYKLYNLATRTITAKDSDAEIKPCLHKNAPEWALHLANDDNTDSPAQK
ncbi:MAG TPA: hypothetical protein VMB71_05155 [Acetobacteraceae bacterium]|nr:hypothetical protein [Acetobacteraceae bacterium]